jgi:hypothetical protein
MWIGKLVLEEKRASSVDVAEEYSRLVKINIFGYSTISLAAYGAVASSILQNKIVYILICFASIQIKLAGLLWNFEKLKLMALLKTRRVLPQLPSFTTGDVGVETDILSKSNGMVLIPTQIISDGK